MKLTIVFRLDFNHSGSGDAGRYVLMWIYMKTVETTGMPSVKNMTSRDHRQKVHKTSIRKQCMC